MQESKREFIKKAGLFSAAGMFGALPSVFGQEMKAGAQNSSVFNVKDFGAKGDGKSADSVAIQKALDAAGEVQGSAYFPSGNYRCHNLSVHSYTTVLAEPQWAYGHDAGAILTIDSEEADCMLDITGRSGCHVRGVVLRGNRNASKIQHGILRNDNRWTLGVTENSCLPIFDEVSVNSFSGDGAYIRKLGRLFIRHSIFRNNKGHGVCVQEGGDGFIIDSQFSDNGKCGFASEIFCSTINFMANRVERNGEYGFFLPGGNCWHLEGSDAWNLTGNYFNSNGGAAVYFNRMNTCTITGNVFRRNGRNAANLTEGATESCHVLLQSCKGITVIGNSGCVDVDYKGVEETMPHYAFWLKNNACCVVAGNVFSEGYRNDMVMDKGGNQSDVIIINNSGSVYQDKLL